MVQNVSLADDNRLCKQVEDLRIAGHEVSVVTRHDPANEPWRALPGLRLVEYPAPVDGDSMRGHLQEYAVSMVRQLPRLVRLHLRHRIDVLQLSQPPDFYFPVAAVARRLGIRVLLDQRDLMPETFAQRYPEAPARAMRVLHWLERRTQRNVDATVTVNGYLRERVIAAGGRAARVSVVANGPVLARVDQARQSTDRDAADLRHGFARVVTWAGKMGRQDRVTEVIRVADRIVHGWGRDDVGFMLLGNGECLEELRALVRELDLADHVWFPGWLSEVDLYRHLAAADVGLDSSLQPEVTPVKALEYLAVGTPLVAYDLPETRRLAEGAGVLVAPDDTEALARELVELLDDAPGRERLGAVGSLRVREQLSWDRQGEVYLAVIAGLLPRPRSSSGGRTRGSRV